MQTKAFIGIDVSKAWIDSAGFNVIAMKEVYRIRLDNDLNGFKELLRWARKIHAVKKEIIICFEDTGPYSHKLYTFLSDKKWPFIMERPMEIKRSMGIQRGKSDKIDAERIARFAYLKRHQLELSKPISPKLTLIKSLLTYRERLNKSILRFSVTSKELSHAFDTYVSKDIVSSSNEILMVLKYKMAEVEQMIAKTISSDATYKRLYELMLSVPGIGPVTASYMLVYSKAFSTHLDYKKFACYCGIAPFKFSSGSSLHLKERVHPFANKKMKALLMAGVMNVISKGDNEFMQYYKRRVAEGKPKMSVINIIKNKLIARVYAAIKRGTPYVKNYQRKVE